MKIIRAKAEIIRPNIRYSGDRTAIYEAIERAGRTCYKSEENITPESSARFVKKIIENGHEAMLEHAVMTVRFTVDRGVSHELVRHRIASFAQESTRYCNYGKDKFGNEITVIEPCFFDDIPEETRIRMRETRDGKRCYTFPMKDVTDRMKQYASWYRACRQCEHDYLLMLDNGAKPEEARTVLPNSLKTEVVMTANMREWRHFFKLRAAGTTGKPHPQMKEVAASLLNECQGFMPELFGDIRMAE